MARGARRPASPVSGPTERIYASVEQSQAGCIELILSDQHLCSERDNISILPAELKMTHPFVEQPEPFFVYGTAWKEDETERLTSLALETGFRAIDTANQRKHYYEEGVGNAVEAAIDDGIVTREELFLQTKFTYERGQDHRLPYDPDADLSTQVEQSFASSLEHLGTDYIDSYVLHGPASRYGLADEDREVWRAMEALHEDGRVGALGVSNISDEQLEALLEHAEVAPTFVQNRCFARTGWDVRVRRLCENHGMTYQGFSLLTANIEELRTHPVIEIAERHEKTLPQVVFRFALQVGMLPLTGTTDETHMRQDLACFDFELDEDDVSTLGSIGV
jgi:diketogulonate reductase-like aldo/keto reductase